VPRFENLDPYQKRDLRHIWRWRVMDTIAGRRRPDRAHPFVTPRVPNEGAALGSMAPSLTWIGHATFLLRLGGLVIATDPVWIDRLGPGLRRNVAPGVALEQTPPVDVVLISHAHHDHLELRTIRALEARAIALRGTPPTYLVPAEVGRYLKRAATGPIVERRWWESFEVTTPEGAPRGTVRFTLVPQQHWSMRTPFDRDEALWGGWVIHAPEGTAYHAGDTGYFKHFAEIGRRMGTIDWAMLPIGAYDPVWFMHPQHMGPEEAGQAFLELGARNLVCMHWGTFKLTDEPLGEPPQRLSQWWTHHGPGAAAQDRKWLLSVGETRWLDQSR
jgi:L-ascorbate metabolism protein UlaG (beta-lactamase superfamily)